MGGKLGLHLMWLHLILFYSFSESLMYVLSSRKDFLLDVMHKSLLSFYGRIVFIS